MIFVMTARPAPTPIGARLRELRGDRTQDDIARAVGAGVLASVVGVHGHINYAGEAEVRNRAMGIDWMTQPELAQAIPPAYTEHIGHQLLEHIRAAA